MNTQLNRLALALCMLQGSQVYALESMPDASLSNVTGTADGISITATSTGATMDNLYLSDQQGTSGGATNQVKYLQLKQAALNPYTAGNNIKANATLKMGSANNLPTVAATLNIDPLLFTVGSVLICNDVAATSCGGTNNSLGTLGLALPNGISGSLKTTGGLLGNGANNSAQVTILLNDANVYLTRPDAAGNNNQMVLSDIRANINANGKLWLDAAQGLRFAGTVDLGSYGSQALMGNNYAAGIQVSLKEKTKVTPANLYTKTTDGNILRLGASGTLTNVNLAVRGTNDATPDASNIMGRVNGTVNGASIVGSQGVALSLSGALSSNASLEIGEAGSGGRTVRFSNLVPFSDVSATTAPAFSLGNIYVNMINSTQVGLPISSNLISKMAFNTAETSLAGNAGSPNLNYLPMYLTSTSALASGDSIAVNLRGVNLSALGKTTEFVNNASGAVTKTVNGSLGITVNNANANLILQTIPGNTALGFGLGLSTTGLAADNKSTTFIGVADTKLGTYLGIRNLDLMVQTAGTMSLDTTAINFNMPYLTIAASGEVAVDKLMSSGNSVNMAYGNNGALFGFNARLNAQNTAFSLVPSANGGGLGIAGSLSLPRVAGSGLTIDGTQGARTRSAGSFLQIVNPSDKSTVGLENISGNLALTGVNPGTAAMLDVGDSSTSGGEGSISFESRLLINNTLDSAGTRTWGTSATDFRIGNVNFYPQGNMATPQRLGEIAIAGGDLYSKITLKMN